MYDSEFFQYSLAKPLSLPATPLLSRVGAPSELGSRLRGRRDYVVPRYTALNCSNG